MTRDINRALEQVERAMVRALDGSGAKPPKKGTPKTSPTIRAWRAPASNHSQYPEPKGCDSQRYSASISAKSLRKAKNTISTNGAEKVFVMLQGRLKGNEIVECGLVAQVKIVKATQDASQ